MSPKVSVVMSVYNGELFLREAVQSILNQSFSDFEFIIVNDSSTDQTVNILTSFDDRRIRLVHNQKNLGLTASLNKGIAQARGEFIARMDADDISLPERLKRQVHYLESHPEIGVLGTAKQDIDSKGHYINKVWVPPFSSGLVRWTLFFGNQIVHPSLMIRKKYFDKLGGYDTSKRTAQDYDLLIRLSKVSKISNLPDVFILYRKNPGSISSLREQEQTETSYRIRQEAIRGFVGAAPKIDELKLIDHYFSKDKDVAMNSLKLMLRLYKSYLKVNPLTPNELKLIGQYAGNKIFNIANANRSYKRIWFYFLWAFWLHPGNILLSIKAVGYKFFGLYGDTTSGI